MNFSLHLFRLASRIMFVVEVNLLCISLGVDFVNAN